MWAAPTATWSEPRPLGATWPTLPEHVKRRLVLEHDDIRFSAADVLWVHEQTGVRLIFDYQHHWCLNPQRLDAIDALRRILATWPDGVRPKIHFSSPRTELREMVEGGPQDQEEEEGAAARRSGRGTPTSPTRSSSPASCATPPGWSST